MSLKLLTYDLSSQVFTPNKDTEMSGWWAYKLMQAVGTEAPVCDPGTEMAETGGRQYRSHPQLHSEFETSPGYVR